MDPTVYVVVWNDLPAGLRAAQAGHAVAQLCREHPDRLDEFASSRLVVCVAGATELHSIVTQATFNAYPIGTWCEPDRGGALTAIALDAEAKPLVRDLPLA